MNTNDMYLSGEYVENNPTYHVQDSPWKAAQIMRMLNKHALQPETVCEVGCGAGEILRQLQQTLPPQTLLHGYEVSPQAHALSKLRENERLKFFLGDALANPEMHYQLALCIDVFEHVEDYFGFLRRLKPLADHTLFHIPLDMTAHAVLRGQPLVRWHKKLGHLHYFSKDTALLALADAGYEIRDWSYTTGGMDLARTSKAKLASLPRRLLFSLSPNFSVRLLGGCSLLALCR